jgi:hypothetical protein
MSGGTNAMVALMSHFIIGGTVALGSGGTCDSGTKVAASIITCKI